MSTYFDDSSYCLEVIPKVLRWLTFEEVFGSEFLSRSGWISTKGKVGFNVSEYRDSVDLSVNIEDARKVLSKRDKRYLYDELSKSPKDALIWLAKEKYFGPGFRVSRTLFFKRLRDVTLEDVNFIIHTVRTGKTNIHFQVSKHIWRRDEMLGRKAHVDRMTKAKRELGHLYNSLVHAR